MDQIRALPPKRRPEKEGNATFGSTCYIYALLGATIFCPRRFLVLASLVPPVSLLELLRVLQAYKQ